MLFDSERVGWFCRQMLANAKPASQETSRNLGLGFGASRMAETCKAMRLQPTVLREESLKVWIQ